MSDDLIKRLSEYDKGRNNDARQKAADYIKELEREQSRLHTQCDGLMQAAVNNGQALILAEAHIEQFKQERERLALAICGGEDAPGYANAQSVEALEKVARDNAAWGMWQVDQTVQAQAKLAKAVEALREIVSNQGYMDDPWGHALATLADLGELEGKE
jgi:hypothetical protein